MDITFIFGLALAGLAIGFILKGRRMRSGGRCIGDSSDEDFTEERKEWSQGYNCYLVAMFCTINACFLLFGSDTTEYILGIGLMSFIGYQLLKKPNYNDEF